MIKHQTKKTPQRSNFIFVLLTVYVLGFLLRIIGIYPGYPANHPDEPFTYNTAIEMVLQMSADPFKVVPFYKFNYPALIIYFQAWLYFLLFVPLALFNILMRHTSEIGMDTFQSVFIKSMTETLGRGQINAMYAGRYISALLSFFAVPLTYLVGKKLFNRYIGLLAALFVAVNYRHILSSHLDLLDAPGSTFALLALYASWQLYKNPSRKNYIIAGITIALSLSVKLFVYSIFPFMVVHLLIALSEKTIIARLRSIVSVNFFLSLVFLVFTFILTNPFLPFHIKTAIATYQYASLRYAFGDFALQLYPIWYLYEIGYGQILSLLFFIGLLLGFVYKKYRTQVFFLLTLVLPFGYIFLYVSRGGIYVRNFSTIIPFISLFSALGFYQLVHLVLRKTDQRKEKWLAIIMVGGGLFVSYSQLKNSLIMDISLSREWNSNCVLAWQQKNLNGKTNIAVTGQVPRLDSTAANYFPYSNFSRYRTAYSLLALQEENIDYLIVDYEVEQNNYAGWISERTRFWGMPTTFLDNSSAGLAQKELSRYSVKDCVKPWQSIDANYSIIKIPKKSPENLELIKMVDLPFNINVSNLSRFNSRVILSEKIPIQEGRKYVVSGSIKSDAEFASNQRDGFLRVDFYKKDNIDFVSKRGVIASVSPVHWDHAPQERRVWAVAPSGSKYMIVSFQVEDVLPRNFFVEDIRIYKDKNNPTIEEISAANKKEVDPFIVYMLSIL